MSYDEEQFGKIRERVLKRFGEDIRHPRLKGRIEFSDVLHDLLEKLATCSEEEFNSFAHRLYFSIPQSWIDEQFEDEIEEAQEQVETYVPTVFCGVEVDSSVIPGKREIVTEYDWRRVYHACLNLMNRRNLLVQRDFSQVIVGEALKDGEESDDTSRE